MNAVTPATAPRSGRARYRETCSTAATYEKRDDAWTVRRETALRTGIFPSVLHCGNCDQYHVTVRVKDGAFKPIYYQVLSLLAQGYRRHEISKELGCTATYVEYILKILRARLNALTSEHLIAIASALGMFNPRDFVPRIAERNHD